MEYNYSLLEKQFIDYIIGITGPSYEQDEQRESKFNIIKNVLLNGFGNETDLVIHIFSFGSFPFKSYHQDSDMDITIFLENKSNGKLITGYTPEFLNYVLKTIEGSLRQYFSQCCSEEYIERIDADVRLIKCKFEGLSFDISISNFVGLFKLIFMHHLEETHNIDTLFYKRTLILIKSWCYYEGCILGSNVGLLGSYALEVLVLYIFNNYADKFTNELEAFFAFFNLMSQIDWENQLVTLYGLFDMSLLTHYGLNIDNMFKDFKFDEKKKLLYEDITQFTKQFDKYTDIDKVQNFNINKKIIPIGKYNMYIIDPIFNTNNLGKSVNLHNFSRIKELFNYMSYECNELAKNKQTLSPSDYFNSLLKLFHKSVVANNTDLFRLLLPEPKIIIIPNKQGAQEHSKDDMNVLTQNFNKKFTLSQEKKDNKKMPNGGINPNYPNKVSGLLWPTNCEIMDEQSLIDYSYLTCTHVNYLTNDIVEFLNKSTGKKPYDFKTLNEATEAEKFQKNVIL